MNQAAIARLLAHLFLLLATGCLTAVQGPPAKITDGPVGELGPAVSPDGHWLAIEYFTTEHPNDPEIWIMPSNGKFSDAKPVLNDSGMVYGEIAWSPDSAWISFIGHPRTHSGPVIEQLFKVNIKTRQVAQLTHLEDSRILGAGTSWSTDGRVAFAMDSNIYVVPESGGPATKLLDIRTKLGHVEPDFPLWSPDSAHLAFVGRGPAFQDFEPHSHGRDLYVADMRTGQIAKVFSGSGDDCPSWFDATHVLVSHQDSVTTASLWLAPISAGRAKPKRLTDGFYDSVPAISRPPAYLYFSRNEEDIRRAWAEGRWVKGFHIWKQRFGERKVALRRQVHNTNSSLGASTTSPETPARPGSVR